MAGEQLDGSARPSRQRGSGGAAAELAAILDVHADLPLITWTAGPGRVGAGRPGQRPGPGGAVREASTAWRKGLVLEDDDEDGSAARRHGFMPRPAATM